jgi:hypothetical protein
LKETAMKMYRINPGYSYRDGAGNVRGAGELIELADDVVALQPNSVTLVPDEEQGLPVDQAGQPA